MTTGTQTREAGIRCGHCKGRHQSVAAVKVCYDTRDCIWQIPAAPGYMTGSYSVVQSIDEAIAEAEDFAAQQAGEIWAENAIERHYEGWYRMPDREEELERRAESSGTPIPLGFY
jgi:hypothetical protein